MRWEFRDQRKNNDQLAKTHFAKTAHSDREIIDIYEVEKEREMKRDDLDRQTDSSTYIFSTGQGRRGRYKVSNVL